MRRLSAEDDDTESIATAGRNVAKGQRHAFGHVGLAPVGRAEGHRGRGVEHQPGDQRPLGQVDSNVRLAGPGGGVPVDQADIVARLIGSHLGQLGARPVAGRELVAGQQASQAPPDRELECPEQRLRRRTGTGRSGRADDRQLAITGRHQALSARVGRGLEPPAWACLESADGAGIASEARSIRGGSTASRIVVSRSSALTSSARAW